MEGWVRHTPDTRCYIVQNPLINSETSWDLGPGTLCCSARTWTNISLSSKMQRNYKGLKVTTYMQSWGKLWTTRYERPKKKTQLLLLKNSEQKHSDGSKSRLLYMTREYNTAKAVGRPLKPPLWPDPYPHPM